MVELQPLRAFPVADITCKGVFIRPAVVFWPRWLISDGDAELAMVVKGRRGRARAKAVAGSHTWQKRHSDILPGGSAGGDPRVRIEHPRSHLCSVLAPGDNDFGPQILFVEDSPLWRRSAWSFVRALSSDATRSRLTGNGACSKGASSCGGE